MRPVFLTLSLVALSTIVAVVLGIAWGWAIDQLRRAAEGASEGAAANDSSGSDSSADELAASSARERLTPDSSVTGGGGWIALCSWCTNRAGTVISLIAFGCLVAMLAMPLYVHAAGWEGMAGKFGWWPMLQGGPRFWFRGLGAAAWIHGAYGACWVGLAYCLGSRTVPPSMIEAAAMDAGPWRVDWHVRWPYLRRWLVAGTACSALFAATEMTVADLYGVRTLADEVYKVYALQPETVPVLSSLLVPALLLIPSGVWIWRLSAALAWPPRGIGQAGRGAAGDVDGGDARWWVALVLVIGITGLVVVVPLASLVVKAGWQVTRVQDVTQEATDAVIARPGFDAAVAWETILRAPLGFRRELAWSLQLALLAMLITVPIALVMARVAQRRPWTRPWLATLALLAALVPGPVVSMAVIWIFNRPTLAVLYDRTLLPSVVALLPRAIPVAFLILRAGYGLRDPGVGECAAIDGLNPARRLWSVTLPQMRRPLGLAAIAVILVGLADLSATLLVLPPGVTTMSTRLFGLLHSGVRNQEAGLALLIAFCAVILTSGVLRVVR